MRMYWSAFPRANPGIQNADTTIFQQYFVMLRRDCHCIQCMQLLSLFINIHLLTQNADLIYFYSVFSRDLGLTYSLFVLTSSHPITINAIITAVPVM